MLLKKLVKEKFKEVGFIVEYQKNTKLYPEYADEFLETNGDREVNGYQYSKKYDVLVVSFKEEVK